MLSLLYRLAAGFALCLSTSAHAATFEHEAGEVTFEQTPSRIVTLEWSLAEIAIDLGVPPIAMAEVEGYQQWVVEPSLPASVQDLGSRREPNLEKLQALKPELILVPHDYTPLLDKLQAIAPVMVLSIYTEDRQPWQRATQITRTLGDVLGKSAEANALIAHTEAQLAHYREQLAPVRTPVALINITDARHVRVHGGQGLYQATLDQLGLTNAWQGQANYWGFATQGIEQLQVSDGTTLFYFQPVADKTLEIMTQSPLWRARDFARDQRVHSLEPVWAFGGLHAGERLARLLTHALTSE
ncbi:iron-siderophore ABC transporter substrate-binding protein [Atopomonas sediminilitoris]|uniref:iron-siderophore ABC transporter substrate-binding protein n=1 Tax=Atopomonas sediminilitoris TaxID=2919919 RepID=UPI001F4DDABF|nr:iron-siderophore ABC transporter substrate-binding protein [Atopomonas sediminilitoris]MCJ8170010.1 iron-siderophore ABC transporter substrate-binding protein [Atopomonas sediminilitoris]